MTGMKATRRCGSGRCGALWGLALSAVPWLLAVADGASAQVGARGPALSPDARAELVLGLLPPAARGGATVLLRDEAGETTHRARDGAFLCVSDATSAQRVSMICHHHVLEARLRFERELARESGLRGSAFRERLCAEVSGRTADIPNGAMEITTSLGRNEDGTWAKEMTVYRLLWLPGETAATAGVADQDPGDGAPWLHRAGTCGAHVMWSEVRTVEVGPK